MNSHHTLHVRCCNLCEPGGLNGRTTVHIELHAVKVLTEKAPQAMITVGSPASQCQDPQDCCLLPQHPSPHSKTAPFPYPLQHPLAEALLTQPEHTAACLYLT